MIKYIYIIVCVCCVMVCVSCDKVDDNGDLGGLWQMTEWKTVPGGNVVATKEDAIFYAVQLDLMKFSINNDVSTYHLARFSHRGDSLFIGKVYARPFDTEVPISELSKYGVPASGGFAIELGSKNMVLRSEEAVLRFRKY